MRSRCCWTARRKRPRFPLKRLVRTAEDAEDGAAVSGGASAADDKLWKGWILPASDADVWLTAGSAGYHSVAASRPIVDKRLDAYRAEYRAAALEGEQPLSKITQSTMSSNWHTLAESKGVLLLDALRRSMGDDAFYALMKDFFDKNTTKTVHACGFRGSGRIRVSKRCSRNG